MIGVVVAVGFLGFIIHIAARFDPFMSSMYIDTIGCLIAWLVPIFLVVWRLKAGLCYDYFKPPVKNRPLFEYLYRVGDKRTIFGTRLPGVDSFDKTHVCIPVGCWLSDSDVDKIVDLVRKYNG